MLDASYVCLYPICTYFSKETSNHSYYISGYCNLTLYIVQSPHSNHVILCNSDVMNETRNTLILLIIYIILKYR